MHIIFASPLAKLLGTREHTITVMQSVTVQEIIVMLARDFAHTKVFNNDAEELVPYVWMVVKNGKALLNLGDLIDNDDELEFIPPIMGG